LVDLRLEGFGMSNAQKPETGEETGKDRETEKSLRFTPLRSYVSRARALAREPRRESALSRLIAVPRLQG
jgi:hypothetical protein